MERILIGLLVFLFLINSALVDYWQAAIGLHKPLPGFLHKDYLAIFWLFLCNFFFPASLIFVASHFDWSLLKFVIGVYFLGSVGWDLIYSYLDTHSLVSAQWAYFYFGGKNFGLSKTQILAWHIIRILLGSFLLL